MNAQNAAQNSIIESLSFAYIEASIEPGMTIAEFRVARPKRPSRRRRVLDALSIAGRREVAAA
jgi:hypothetical protein